MGNTSDLCSQLGAVLGMLGDCWFVLGLYLPFSSLCNFLAAMCLHYGAFFKDTLPVYIKFTCTMESA